jgi:flagellar motor switch protein FliG
MAEMSVSRMDSLERAAVLLMSLGEEGATEVLRHMGPKEVQKLGAAMATLANVTKNQVSEVLSDFVDIVEDQTSLGVGNEDYIRKVLVNALGADKAGGVIDRILLGANSKGLEQLKWMDARQIAELIRTEHPQIIAIILAYLDADLSAEVIALFPEKVRVDIVMRVATLDGIQPSALQELNDIMEKQFTGDSTSNIKSSSVGGIKVAANILNNMEGGIDGNILEEVNDMDPELSQQIQDNMFIFDNMIEIDDRGIQLILREISTDTLIVALKGADETLKEKILQNMSKRASEMLRDDLEAKGPVKLSEVDTAQKEILAVARRMADSGEISIGGKGEEYVS